MSEFFSELRERVRRTMQDEGGELGRLVRTAFETDRQRSPLERSLIAVTGLSAAAVGVGLATTSMLGLALAAVILYVVLTKVFGFELKLDPATLFGGLWPPPSKPGTEQR